jgi:Fe2+ or Zn2+ uptake regulation protein
MAVRDTMSIGEFVAMLVRAGYRITVPRRAVLDLVLSRDGAFSTADLVADSRRRGLPAGRATIFRTLEILTGLGPSNALICRTAVTYTCDAIPRIIITISFARAASGAWISAIWA